MWTDLAARIWPALPYLFAAGVCFACAGAAGIVVFRSREVTLGPVPRKLTDPPTVILPRVDSDTGVIPSIPGATPVCPICGAPFHAVCPSAPKERTEDTVALPSVEELAPQIAALGRFFEVVDEATEELAVTAVLVRDGNHTAAAEVDEAILRRVADGLREPADVVDDCPLTTQEIPPLLGAPLYAEASARLGDTRELSAALLEKVRQA